MLGVDPHFTFSIGGIDMKKALLALVAATAFTGSAFAADMAVKAPPMAPPPPPPPTFTGCWLSGGVGYGLFDQENSDFDTFDTGIQFTDRVDTGGRGWFGRVGGGCDYQFGGGYGGGGGLFGGQGFVIGGFADYDWTNIRGNLGSNTFNGVGSENMNNQWAIGARVGWVPLPGLLTFVSAAIRKLTSAQPPLPKYLDLPSAIRSLSAVTQRHIMAGSLVAARNMRSTGCPCPACSGRPNTASLSSTRSTFSFLT